MKNFLGALLLCSLSSASLIQAAETDRPLRQRSFTKSPDKTQALTIRQPNMPRIKKWHQPKTLQQWRERWQAWKAKWKRSPKEAKPAPGTISLQEAIAGFNAHMCYENIKHGNVLTVRTQRKFLRDATLFLRSHMDKLGNVPISSTLEIMRYLKDHVHIRAQHKTKKQLSVKGTSIPVAWAKKEVKRDFYRWLSQQSQHLTPKQKKAYWQSVKLAVYSKLLSSTRPARLQHQQQKFREMVMPVSSRHTLIPRVKIPEALSVAKTKLLQDHPEITQPVSARAKQLLKRRAPRQRQRTRTRVVQED
jgi:hypothetical protein